MIRKPKRKVDATLKQKIKYRTQKGWGYTRIISDLGISQMDKDFDIIHSYIHYCLSLKPKRVLERKEKTKKRRQDKRQTKKIEEVLKYVRQTRQFDLPDNLKIIQDKLRQVKIS